LERVKAVYEKDALHVYLLIGNDLNETLALTVLSKINELCRVKGRKRVVIHVISSKNSPLIFEDLRGILLNNIHLTISIHHSILDLDIVRKALSENGVSMDDKFFILIGDLTQYTDLIKSKGFQPIIVEEV